METLGAKKGKKGQIEYYCENCDFICSKKYSWNRHILTSKHVKEMQEMKENDFGAKKGKKEQTYLCSKCKKCFQTNSGLWKHNKICNVSENDTNETAIQELNNQITPELVMSILHQNKEFQQMLIEQNKTIIELSKNNSITNNGNINSHNKTFNLQVFLNETCKDAMNIMDFVNSLKIELSDLENVGNVGYVNGISSIIVKNLNLLDETKRPVHCADTKREVMYVKDDNKWEKDNENKSQMRKIIKHATHKNSKLLKEYKAKYPGCEKSESKYSYAYDKLIVETFGGKGDDEIGKENKIIRNIAKNVTISKDNF